MAKKPLENFFKHIAGTKDEERSIILIEGLGVEGYGIYWILMEQLRVSDGYSCSLALLPALARRYNSQESKFRAVVEKFGLFTVVDGRFYSQELLDDMGHYERVCASRSISGAAGGKAKAEAARSRGNGSKSVANATQEPGDCQANAEQKQSESVASSVQFSSVQYKTDQKEEERAIDPEHEQPEPPAPVNDREKAFASLPQSFHKSSVKSEAIRFAEWFRDFQSPERIKVSSTMLASWAMVWYHLRVTDKRNETKDELKEVIAWARGDPFWSINFLSPVKLREKDGQGQMYIDRFIAERNKRNGNGTTTTNGHSGLVISDKQRQNAEFVAHGKRRIEEARAREAAKSAAS